ncbi:MULTISPECIES: S8 family peptidase [unclassified Acinetobacter]|uniref:S8 family peptidase n=1 Tax=unclassified Acinetobacter TaxID=196816 RepID=UPI002D1E86D1|nr:MULTISPECIES: S8 family serine peptidase [unclassified Acinetobacter]MEB3795424.1 S8 family serine peptidase [Acinetobacter sp. IK24]MEB3814573.1 S8 family serine peptidase [Acinetobacter sp. IK22]MEB3833834.1 S8 family serine peptidase [Acinetobacter sp. IK23]MEB3839144.1 S8 family serine peptidase [Acinetobacter sp. IK25]
MQNKLIFTLGACVLFSSTVSAAPLQAAQAKQQLTETAKNKVSKSRIDLNALVTNDSNDLIVEYNLQEEALPPGEQKRQYIANNRTLFKNKFTKSAGVQTLREFNGLPIGLYRISNRETLVKLLNDPTVKAVYPNRINQATTMQSLPLINQPQASSNGFSGKDSSVMVIDTGVNYLHPDFGGCTAVGSPSTCKVIAAFDTAPEDNQLDDGGHGTNVAAIVGKVAPATKLIVADSFRKVVVNGQVGDTAYDSDIIAGINWAINNANTYKIKAVNLSLGVPNQKYTSECPNSGYATVFANARAAGIVPVVAAGNDGFADGVSSPACTPGAVRVGAVYDSNVGGLAWGGTPPTCIDRTTAADQVACFSNGGKLLTLLAPGAMITAGGYTMGGTSQAAPHVAGAIAALRGGVSSTETIDQTINRLKTTGKPITDRRSGLVFPRIDLLAATNGLTIN